MTTAMGPDLDRQHLEATIACRMVEPVFQPIVDLQQAHIAGFEALSRPTVECPFRDVQQMFDAAESTGMLWSLEHVTRQLSLAAATGWPSGVQLFINTTPQVFSDPRFAESVLEAVRSTGGLTPGRVVLEITERSDTQYSEGLEEQARLVKAAGFQIAIDDVGAGTSGLSRMIALRPHWLKLDRDLISGIDRDRVKQNLLRFFLGFARMSGVQMIAEGIETREELQTVIDLGVHFGQGYYLGRPGSRDQSLDEDLTAWLRSVAVRTTIDSGRDARNRMIERYARPTLTTDLRTPIREVASTLLRQLSAPGVAVLDGKRLAGWCDRDQVLRAASDSRASNQIGFISNADAVTITADTTVTDSLEIAASRDERSIHSPLILADNGHMIGIVTIRDLLHAASEVAREVHCRTAPLTGLPSRVRADEHLIDQIRSRTVGGAAPSMDAAFVDIRRFTRYNAELGYELGDELLKRLTEMLDMLVARGDPNVFVAHIGDDRFLVTGNSGSIERRLARLAKQFDKTFGAAPSGYRQGDGSETGVFTIRPNIAVSLRILLFPNVFGSITTPRELYQLADRLHTAGDDALTSTIERHDISGPERATA